MGKMNNKLTWKDIWEKQKRIEILGISIMAIILTIGIIAEALVCKHIVIWQVLNLDTVSLIILQIQATIDTLTIALLSLIGSRMDNSYMGINWNDYQLNCKPVWLKEKRIVYGTLILLIINIILHMTGRYNLVFAVFLITCILIGVSVSMIYAAFTENTLIGSEIKRIGFGPLGTGISGFFCVPGGIDGVILKKTEVKIEGSCKISVS